MGVRPSQIQDMYGCETHNIQVTGLTVTHIQTTSVRQLQLSYRCETHHIVGVMLSWIQVIGLSLTHI